MELYPYQIAGRDYLASRERAMLADDMGLGKTIQAIAALDKVNGYPALVVCPAGLVMNWNREIVAFLRLSKTIHVVGGKNTDINSDIVICSYAQLHKISALTFHTIIADEAHYLKTPRAKRTKSFFTLARRSTITWFLTGTPITSSIADAWTTFSFVAPDIFPRKFSEFVDSYCVPRETPWGMDYSLAINMLDFNKKAREHVFLRRTKDEVLPQLPRKIYSKIYLVPTAGQLKSIERLAEDIDLDALSLVEHSTTLRKTLAEMKALTVADYAKEILEEKGNLVIFGIHTAAIHTIVADLRVAGIRVCCVTGLTTTRNRQAAVDSFQSGNVQVFVGNIQAAGVGLTLTAADTIIFLERSWVPAENVQAEDRIHRIGQTNVCQIIDCVVPDSIDEAVLGVLLRKQKTIREAIDGKEEEGKGNGSNSSRGSETQRTVSLPDIRLEVKDVDELPWWVSSE